MIGTKLTHYEITSHLGSGGMGDVYQAADLKLGRSVAVKFLPESFAHDGDRIARFEREARVLASLNHPNIAAIYGLENADDKKFLVMELVPGETLAERIKRGPISVEEALWIGKQIAEALEAAHEQGVIHRDLKPANIKVTADGKVKVLDFGLAKAFEHGASNTNLSQSPTMSLAATNAGVILGTAAYMSPEQAKGKEVDRRADIWAFGAVLYEILTGRLLFSGETVSETMAFVMTKEPDWNALPANTPARLRDLLRRCLIREPRNRVRDIGDVRIAIEEAVMSPLEVSLPPVAAPGTRDRVWMGLAVVFLLALAVVSATHFREAPPEVRAITTTLLPPDNAEFDFSGPHAMPAISPDGTRIVYGAKAKDGKMQLWLRRVDSPKTQPLPGTEGAATPFWSPDSRWVGFGQENKLQKIDIQGGPPVQITDLNR